MTPSRKRLFILLPAAAIAVAALVVFWLTSMPGRSYSGPFEALNHAEEAMALRLGTHMNHLVTEIGPRNIDHPSSMDRTAEFLAERLESIAIGTERHEFEARGETFVNVIGEVRGRTAPGEIVVLGAHYDTFRDSPGADDNASGVAALLELARQLRPAGLARTVRFAFFANEEPPFFGTEDMGSVRYANRCRDRGEDIAAMISLESLGYYAHQDNSQSYPGAMGLLKWRYPETGDFLAFVGNLASRSLVREAIGAFREHAEFASEGLVAPESVPGVAWSDHASFWAAGYPALMLTDTAPFRNPNYHTDDDILARVDLLSLARLTLGIQAVVEEIGGGAASHQ